MSLRQQSAPPLIPCARCGGDGVERVGEGPFNKTGYACRGCGGIGKVPNPKAIQK